MRARPALVVWPALLLVVLGGCAREPPRAPQARIAPGPVGLPAPPLTVTVVVTERGASLAGATKEDDVRSLPRFQRLDGLYHDLKQLRGAVGDGDNVRKHAPAEDRAMVDARSNATSLAVFSAVMTCAYAGFRHVGLRSDDGAFVEGEVFVIDNDRHPVNARVVDTVLRARLRPDGVDVAWSGNRRCAELPAAGQTTVSELEAWVDRVCPAGNACFDVAILDIDPRVPVRDVVRGLTSLERRAAKPLLYGALVMSDAKAPQQHCDDKH